MIKIKKCTEYKVVSAIITVDLEEKHFYVEGSQEEGHTYISVCRVLEDDSLDEMFTTDFICEDFSDTTFVSLAELTLNLHQAKMLKEFNVELFHTYDMDIKLANLLKDFDFIVEDNRGAYKCTVNCNNDKDDTGTTFSGLFIEGYQAYKSPSFDIIDAPLENDEMLEFVCRRIVQIYPRKVFRKFPSSSL